MIDDGSRRHGIDGRHGRLSGQVAIVTGSGASEDGVGNGFAIAALLAREGARVCVNDLDSAHAGRTLDAVRTDGGEAFSVIGDVTDPEVCKQLVALTLARYGQLDVLVNNVGVGRIERVVDVDPDDWERQLQVNLKSALLMCKYAIPPMTSGGGGSIVNIVSVNGLLSGGGSAYGASKAGLLMLTRDIAVDYGRDSIRANAVAPGHVWTPLVQRARAELRDRRRLIAPLGVEGTAWDVAWAVVFLASDEARFVSGACLPVDGGATSILPLKASAYLDG